MKLVLKLGIFFLFICMKLSWSYAQTESSVVKMGVENKDVNAASENSSLAGTLLLNESLIKNVISNKPPEIQQIEASFLDSKRNYLSAKDELGLRLDADGEVYKSNERQLAPFDAFTQSASQYNVGLVKPTAYGVDLSVKAFGQKSTNAFVSGATTQGVVLGLTVDLFKDFLGRKTKSNLKQTALNLKRAGYEKSLNIKTFESNLRKTYWSLVANKEQKILVESLIVTAENQLKDASERQRSGVADAGETARFKSQLSTRKSNLLSLSYQESEYLKSLRISIPEFDGRDLVLAPYDLDQTIRKAYECIAIIKSQTETPLEFTLYDEIVELLMQEERQEQRKLSSYNDPDLKLVAEVSNVGKDFSYDGARQDFVDDPRDRSRLALNLSIPLDGSKTNTKEISELAIKNRYISQAQMNLSKIKSYHHETVRIIETLYQILASQKETTNYLNTSLDVSRKKFNQGRISLQELISEQDSYIQNKLNEIDNNLTLINTLIDYLSIYSETPCEFNRI